MYNQTIKNIRTILENANQELQNMKDDKTSVRTMAMEQIKNEKKNYHALVDSLDIKENERNVLKSSMDKIVKDGLSAAQKSNFAMSFILDDRQFTNVYGNDLYNFQTFEPKS